MNILFAHDHILIKNKEKYFSKTGVGSKIFFDRYAINDKDSMLLYTRYKKENKNDNLNEIYNEKVKALASDVYQKPIDYFLKKKKINQEIDNILNSNKIDLCVVRLYSILGISVYKRAKKKNIPIIVEVVSCPINSLWYYDKIKGKILAPLMYIETKRIAKKSSYTHYVTEKYLQKKYPCSKGLCIGCSDVIIKNISNEIMENKINKIKNQTNENIRLGLVGSLNVDYKGHALAIKMLSKLKHKNVELHFLGNGERSKWENLSHKYGVNDKIFFDGILPSGEPVNEWLDSIDILLVPSKTEGLPRIIIEAMSRGGIVVASNVGGIPEILEQSELLRKNDVQGFANRVDEILNDKNLKIKISKRNFEKSKEYLYEVTRKRLKEFYKNVYSKENIYE